MARYDEEKVLYFADKKGLHLSPTERSNTTLSGLVRRAVKGGYLALAKHDKSGRYYQITESGQIRLLTLQIQARQRMGKDVSEHQRKLTELTSAAPKTADKPSAATAPTPVARPLSDSAVKKALAPLRETQGVLTVFHDEPGLSAEQQQLLQEGWLSMAASDDAGKYYEVTDKARLLLPSLPAPPSAAGTVAPATPVKLNPSTAPVTPSPPADPFAAYVQQGMALAKAQLSPAAFEAINDLHWDGAYEDGQSVEQAVRELVAMEPQLLQGQQQQQQQQACLARIQALSQELNDDYGAVLEAPQLKKLFIDRVKDRVGFTLDGGAAAELLKGRTVDLGRLLPPLPSPTQSPVIARPAMASSAQMSQRRR